MKMKLHAPTSIQLHEKVADSLIEQLEALDATVDEIALDCQQLMSKKTLSLVIRVINHIPANIKRLELFTFDYAKTRSGYREFFSHVDDDSLMQFYTAIGERKLTHFKMKGAANLSIMFQDNHHGTRHNQRRFRPSPVILHCFSALKTLQEISLNLVDLYFIDDKYGQSIYSELNPALNTLRLIDMDREILGDFRKIPPTIKKLIFSKPFYLSSHEIKTIFEHLSETSIEELDLQNIYFHKIPVNNLQTLAGSLVKVSTLCLSSDDIESMTFEQLDAFAKIAPNAVNIIAMKNNSPVDIRSEKVRYLDVLKSVVDFMQTKKIPMDTIKYFIPFLFHSAATPKAIEKLDALENAPVNKHP